MQDKVLIFDFGSQYTQLIARRVRELFIYCERHPFNNPPKNTEEFNASYFPALPIQLDPRRRPHPDLSTIRGKLPLLAVCYGAQYLAHFSGGQSNRPTPVNTAGQIYLLFSPGKPFLKELIKAVKYG